MILPLITFLVAFSGCATQSSNISSSYIPVATYKDYDCEQLASEANHVNRRLTELYYSLKQKANNDAWQMGLGLVLFWPVLFALEGGDGPEASEYSRLKGEYEAIRRVAIGRKCSLNTIPEFKSPEDFKKESEQES